MKKIMRDVVLYGMLAGSCLGCYSFNKLKTAMGFESNKSTESSAELPGVKKDNGSKEPAPFVHPYDNLFELMGKNNTTGKDYTRGEGAEEKEKKERDEINKGILDTKKSIEDRLKTEESEGLGAKLETPVDDKSDVEKNGPHLAGYLAGVGVLLSMGVWYWAFKRRN